MTVQFNAEFNFADVAKCFLISNSLWHVPIKALAGTFSEKRFRVACQRSHFSRSDRKAHKDRMVKNYYKSY